MEKTGLSIKKLSSLLKQWQKRLLLDDWTLSLKIVDFKRRDFRQSGDIKICKKKKEAVVLLTKNPIKDEEKVLVHELIHLLLCDFDHFCEKLALKGNKPFEGDHDKYMGKLEKITSQLTEIFLLHKK